MYSDMSTLIRASSLPNTISARALESSVLPTPVGPRNRNDPIGLFGSLSPTLLLLIARDTAVTASSWPTTLLWSSLSRRSSFFDSFSVSLLTGILVHTDTTSAISFSWTVIFLWLEDCFLAFFFASSFCLALTSAAASILPAMSAFSRSSLSVVSSASTAFFFS